jgi:catechol 2,3-dioxygenase-like lactoylglutathione lyase family enzyme
VIDHVGFEVSDLQRSARFYDAVFRALGARRMFESEHAVAYGINDPQLWIVVRGRTPSPGYGHVAISAGGKAAVEGPDAGGVGPRGRGEGAPGQRPQYGRRYYAGYLRDPDGLRVEVVAR